MPPDDFNGIDVDALEKQIAEPAQGRPQSHAEPEAEQTAAAPAKDEWEPSYDKFSIKWQDKDLFLNLTKKEDYERLRTWAQQGYDYPRKMEKFKQEYGQFLGLKPERLSQYSEIDKFAQANPQWWRHVEESWNSRAQQAAQTAAAQSPDGQVPPEVLQKLQSQFEERFSSLENMLKSKEESAKIAEEDSALDQEIKGVREKYPKYNFDQIMTDDGKTLEFLVFEHAAKIGTNSFQAAFRDFYHDQLVKDAQIEASEKAAKERQKMAKDGLLGKTPAPTKGLKGATNYKSKSYDDLFAEGMKELGI